MTTFRAWEMKLLAMFTCASAKKHYLPMYHAWAENPRMPFSVQTCISANICNVGKKAISTNAFQSLLPRVAFTKPSTTSVDNQYLAFQHLLLVFFSFLVGFDICPFYFNIRFEIRSYNESKYAGLSVF